MRVETHQVISIVRKIEPSLSSLNQTRITDIPTSEMSGQKFRFRKKCHEQHTWLIYTPDRLEDQIGSQRVLANNIEPYIKLVEAKYVSLQKFVSF